MHCAKIILLVFALEYIFVLCEAAPKSDRYFPLTGFGETCSDISLYSIVDEDECIRVAAEHFGLTYSGNEATSNYPAGCYIYGVTSKTVYFNKHKSGSANPNTVEICNQDCQTFGGNSPGDKCMFPFIWNGVTYEGCTKVDNNGQAWCATSYKPGGTNIDGWTNCRDGCPMQDYTCGVKPLSISKKIVNGVEAEPYSIPWQVRLSTCGGTLISPRHVLTAAHCWSRMDSELVVGDHWKRNPSDGIVHKVCRYKDHPKYDRSRKAYDFSIMHLKEPVDIGPQAVPACLPTSKHSGDFLVGKNLTVSGWGALYAGGHSPDVLHVVDVKGISNEQCRKMYSKIGRGHMINSENLCAGDIIDGGEDSCQGDSGGPLTYNDNGHATLVGVVSWGKGCADRRFPGIYSRVTDVLPWIQEELAKTC